MMKKYKEHEFEIVFWDAQDAILAGEVTSGDNVVDGSSYFANFG